MASIERRNVDILITGKTGNGKSALGNTILQKKAFQSRSHLKYFAKKTQSDYSEFENRIIKVVDVPGVGDSDRDKKEGHKLVLDMMSKAVMTNPEGFHAILIVGRYGVRFTEEEVKSIKILKDIFGHAFIANHGILVMTCGDQFMYEAKENGVTFEQWCQNQGGVFSELLAEVNNRVILFNNREENVEACNEQIRRLLQMIDDLSCDGARYTSEIFAKAKLSRNRLILQEHTIREAGLITQQLCRAENLNPKEAIKHLESLKARSEALLQNATEQDKGTKGLAAAIKVAKALDHSVKEQLEHVKKAAGLKENEEEPYSALDACHLHHNMASNERRNVDILMFGKTGNGKSALGNTILQRKAFQSRSQVESVTKEAQSDYSEFENRIIKVVSVPGVGDSDKDKKEGHKLVVEAMTKAVMANPEGFHAILIVVRYGGRYTKEEVETIKILKDIFGEAFVANHGILVMTCGDIFKVDAEKNGKTFAQWCQTQGGVFSELLAEVNNRVILFNNREKDIEACNEQIKRLLHMIDGLSSYGARYTSKTFVEELLRNRLMSESERPLPQENAFLEAERITQQLGLVDWGNPKKAIFRLQSLRARSQALLQNVTATIKVAEAVDQAVTERLEMIKKAIDLNEKEEELQRKIEEGRLLDEKRKKEQRKVEEKEERKKKEEEKRKREEEERRKEEERMLCEDEERKQYLGNLKNEKEKLEALIREEERRVKERREAERRWPEERRRAEERRAEEQRQEDEERACKEKNRRHEEEASRDIEKLSGERERERAPQQREVEMQREETQNWWGYRQEYAAAWNYVKFLVSEID